MKGPTVGPFCDTVRPSQRGRNWHKRQGETACPTCYESVAVYNRLWRLKRGKGLLMTADQLKSFALAWDPAVADEDKRVVKAVGAAFHGI